MPYPIQNVGRGKEIHQHELREEINPSRAELWTLEIVVSKASTCIANI